MRKDAIARLVFFAAGVFLVFVAGFASSHFRVFPYGFLSRAMNQAARVVQNPSAGHEVHPARHDFAGARAWDENGKAVAPVAKPGRYVLLTSNWPEIEWRSGIRLVDEAGAIVHTWDMREAMKAWPDRASLLDKFASFTYVHGTHLFENGDVLANVEYMGMVRLNAASHVVWKTEQRTHHSIHPSDAGTFWACGNRMIEAQSEVARRFPGLTAPLVEDFAIEVSAQGKVLEEISILEAVYKSSLRNRLLSFPVGQIRSWDILHTNDVEPLPAKLAKEYPGLAAGDLLVSMRDLSTIMVLDPKTRAVKWSASGPMLRQHDPDFIGGGEVSVFDNDSDETPAGEALGGSRLIALPTGPAPMAPRRIYPAEPPAQEHGPRFYAFLGGKAQLLEGGRWLLTEATAGRVFEIDDRGRVRWEWCHEKHDGNMVSEVMEGTRYDLNPDSVKKWARSSSGGGR